MGCFGSWNLIIVYPDILLFDICGQGIHEKCYVEKMQDITTLPKIKGFHWLCSYCESHAILGPKTTNKKPAVAPSTSRVQHNNTQTPINVQHHVPNPETTQSTLTTSNDQVHREEPTENTPHSITQTNTNSEQKPTCIHYKNNRCKHGISGKNCDYRHPKPCKNVWHLETKQKNGCSKGRTCEFLHPKVCRTSINKHECFNDNCKFMHIKGTKRQKPINENITGQTNPKEPGNLAYAEACRTQPNQATTQYMQQQPQQTPTAQSFLEILQQIQTRLKMIETAQRGQASQIQAIITPQRTQAEIPPRWCNINLPR